MTETHVSGTVWCNDDDDDFVDILPPREAILPSLTTMDTNFFTDSPSTATLLYVLAFCIIDYVVVTLNRIRKQATVRKLSFLDFHYFLNPLQKFPPTFLLEN